MNYLLEYVRAKVLVKIVSSDLVILERKAARQIADLAEQSYLKREAIYSAKGITALVKLLGYEDAETTSQATRAIANLTSQSSLISDNALHDFRLLYVLAQLLLNECPETKWQASRAIASITQGANNLSHIVSGYTSEKELNLLRNLTLALISLLSNTETRIRINAARAIGNLARHIKRINDEDLEFNLCRSLVRLLSKSDKATKRQVTRTIAALIDCYPIDAKGMSLIFIQIHVFSYRNILIKAKAIECLINLLSSDIDDKTKQYANNAILGLQKVLPREIKTTEAPLKWNPPSLEEMMRQLGLTVDDFENEYPFCSDANKPYYCPISLEPMLDPVILADTGNTYERKAIETALRAGQSRDPLTNQKIKDVTLTPNRNLRDLMEAKIMELAQSAGCQHRPSL